VTELGVSLVALETLLAESDFVTLHANLRPDNIHLIDESHLALMRPTAVLINTARGSLVDEHALVAALSSGRLEGAALDVFEQEPLAVNHPLRQLSNVYLSPHNANASPSAAERVHAHTIGSLLRCLEVSAT
jgi:D-3-phosphoglycerate dehydrogenase